MTLYKGIRAASRGSFLKPFNKLAARILSGLKPHGLRPRDFKPDKTLLLVY